MDAVVLASPDYYDVKYAINPLTNKTSKVNKDKAMKQFRALVQQFKKRNIPVHILDPSPKFPDLVFVSNSALILRGWPRKVAILARYAKPERRGEELLAGNLLHSLGYKVISLPDEPNLHYEGQGDSRWSHDGKDLWLCYGTGRTTKRGIEAVREVILKEALESNWLPPTIHQLHIIEKKTYHLDLCFLPLPNNRLLLHETSFSTESRNEILEKFGRANTIHIPLRLIYTCNSVWLDEENLLLPKLPWSEKPIEKKTRMNCHEIDVSEFHLAGGSVSCMVLALWQCIKI
jgi:N-dimethylarginine dimethylaminohydrolase